ncbi:tail fiber domain-containing protein [Serratia marcescens]|uniref:tail fiber domain-containing protein n=1 Tax=Serratia marcescens TaxID=615 RepID=UPI001869D06E|nr:tail fiber domain-containing protein [Serratia marcescens]
MANNKIQHYRTTVAGRQPDASKMLEGEIAINLSDKKIYSKLGTSLISIGHGADSTINGSNTWTGKVKSATLESGATTLGGTNAIWIDVKQDLKVTGKTTTTDLQASTLTAGNITSTGSITVPWLKATEQASFSKGVNVAGDITGGTIRASGWLVSDHNRIQIRNEGTKLLQFSNSNDSYECGAIISEWSAWANNNWRLVLRTANDANADAWLQADGTFSAHVLYARNVLKVSDANIYADGNIWGVKWANSWGGSEQRFLANWLEQRFSNVSDETLKKDIKKAKPVLDDIKKMNFVKYKWKSDMSHMGRTEHVNNGIIAQEIEKINDSLIIERDGIKSIDVLQTSVMALQAVKELNEKIESLEKQLADSKKTS